VRGGGGGTECRVGRGRRLCETGHMKTGGPWAATVGGRIRLGKTDAEFLDARCATKWEQGTVVARGWTRVWNSYSIPRVHNINTIYIYIYESYNTWRTRHNSRS
jgi:hypothetical protein